jgi:hypothetical protein
VETDLWGSNRNESAFNSSGVGRKRKERGAAEERCVPGVCRHHVKSHRDLTKEGEVAGYMAPPSLTSALDRGQLPFSSISRIQCRVETSSKGKVIPVLN